MRSSLFFLTAAAFNSVLACDSCYGPATEVVHERHVRRMQPGAQDATVGPKAPLEWGQLNFLHTVSLFLTYHCVVSSRASTWLDRRLICDRRIPMVGSKAISRNRTTVLIGVILFRSRDICSIWLEILVLICCLLILVRLCGRVLCEFVSINVWETGDLHDGNGLSDAALPNGVLSNPIFDEIEYDILTIGMLFFLHLGCPS